jgi:alpha-amylase
MNWDSIDREILDHYRKISSFRHRNIAVGAGDHILLKEEPYTFSRTYSKDGLDNRVIVVIGAEGETTIDVSSVFADGDTVRDAYSMEAAVVKKGKVTFTADENGLILLEKLVKK